MSETGWLDFRTGDPIKTQAETIKDLQQKLLASQASEARLREALKLAEEFISNGIEFDYIRMPDDSLKGIDSAHETPNIIAKALSTQPNTVELEAHVESEIDKFASEVKGLCQDFSSMNGNVYILDVKGAIDGLVELYARKDKQ